MSRSASTRSVCRTKSAVSAGVSMGSSPFQLLTQTCICVVSLRLNAGIVRNSFGRIGLYDRGSRDPEPLGPAHMNSRANCVRGTYRRPPREPIRWLRCRARQVLPILTGWTLAMALPVELTSAPLTQPAVGSALAVEALHVAFAPDRGGLVHAV